MFRQALDFRDCNRGFQDQTYTHKSHTHADDDDAFYVLAETTTSLPPYTHWVPPYVCVRSDQTRVV
jgi:hypothetical protein